MVYLPFTAARMVNEPPRLYTLLRLAAEPLPPVKPRPDSTDHVSQSYCSGRGKSKSKNKSRSLISSERGLKFRLRQQEHQITLMATNTELRRELTRPESSRNACVFARRAPYSTSGAPVKYCMAYFDQFRNGLSLPGAPATELSSEKQRLFLNAMIEPGTMFGTKPAVELILTVWENYSRFHSSVSLAFESAELITADGCAIVVVHGVLHLRYSRNTIQHVFPHVASEVDLIQKLIGRQVHVHYRAMMHFNASGKLEGYQMEPDFVGALMEVLGDLRDCARILGSALIKGHVLGENVCPEVARCEPQVVSPASSRSTQAMDLDYILS